jgi:hypothetical protein
LLISKRLLPKNQKEVYQPTYFKGLSFKTGRPFLFVLKTNDKLSSNISLSTGLG